MNFENELLNCSRHVDSGDPPEVPPGERYLDSTLVRNPSITFIRFAIIHVKFYPFQPVVTKDLIAQCDSIAKQLDNKYGKKKRYKYEYFKGDRSEVFKMLTSNVSLTVQLLDELRKEPK